MYDVSIVTNQMEKSITFVLPDGRKETYALNEIPSKDSYIVKTITKEIGQSLQIATIVDNLNNIAELLYISACALVETKVSSKVTHIQHEYTKLCGQSKLSVHQLCLDSRKAAIAIGNAYESLTKGREYDCINEIKKCEQIALNMAKEAEVLANAYVKLGDEANETVEMTQDEVAVQKEKAQKMEEDRDRYEAQLNAQLAAQESLNSQLAELNAEYQKVQKLEEEALGRKHGFEIAGIVSGVVGGVVDMFTPDFGLFGGDDEKEDVYQEAAKQEIDELKEELSNAEEEYRTELENKGKLETEEAKLQAEIEVEEKRYKEMEAADTLATDEGKALITTLDEHKVLLATCSANLLAATAAVEAAENAVNSLKQMLAQMTEQFESCATSAAAEAERAAQTKEKIYEDKIELEEQRRESLSQIAEFTTMIESCSKQQEMAETALRTLNMAVSCIKQVVTSLMNASLFWKSLSLFCNRLHESDLDEAIENNMKYCEEDTRVAYYFEADFMLMMLKFLSQWSSLYYVCKDYEYAISEIPEKQAKYYSITLSPDKAMEEALRMSQSLSSSIEVQIQEQDALIEEMKANQ